MDLDEVADELYAVSPEDFAARRDALVAAARSAGERDLAKLIGKLRKPILAAALVNAVIRSEPAELTTLTELGTSMRSAQRELRGAELRELSGQRQRLLARLVQLAGDAAGRSLTEAVLSQVRATFEAAIADETAEAAVLSGRLTTALSYTGFGEVDVTDAVGVARSRPRHLSVVREAVVREAVVRKSDVRESAARPTAAERATEQQAADQRLADQRLAEQRLAEVQRAADLQRAADAVAAAHGARADADEAARGARAELGRARERTAVARVRVDELAGLLDQARAALNEVASAQRTAKAVAEAAARAAEQAAEAEHAAKDALSGLAQGD